MKFPWQKQELETRQQSSGYTEAIIDQLIASASGTGATSPATIAALETAAGMWGRAFACAKPVPKTRAVEALTPLVLEMIGRELVRNGAYLAEIEVVDGKVKLMPAAYWDVYGDSADSLQWTYRATFSGPDTTTTKLLSAERVLHCRYGTSPVDPWIGVAPLNRASTTAELVGTLESKLSLELKGPVGSVMPLPQGQRDTLKTQLKGLKGGMALVDTVAEWVDAQSRRPSSDWQQQRIGARPPGELIALRQDLTTAVLDACGVPAVLAGTSDGVSQREGWRRFAHGTIAPALDMVAIEAAEKLDAPGLKFDITELYASDLAGRATAFRNLVSQGVEIERALAITGLLIEE